jgi:hypothetical protein
MFQSVLPFASHHVCAINGRPIGSPILRNHRLYRQLAVQTTVFSAASRLEGEAHGLSFVHPPTRLSNAAPLLDPRRYVATLCVRSESPFRADCSIQFSLGFSTWSIITRSTGALAGSNLIPSRFSMLARIEEESPSRVVVDLPCGQ